MISCLESLAEAPSATAARDWWVVKYCRSGGSHALAVCCKLTMACATVYDPSPEEIAAAEKHPGDWKYRWNDESRLTLLDLKKLG